LLKALHIITPRGGASHWPVLSKDLLNSPGKHTAKLQFKISATGYTNTDALNLPAIVHFFSSVAHRVPGAKTTEADCEKVCFFLNAIFMSVRILNFNAIHTVIKKMFHKGPVAANANGACQK
jgi:hypothetical protein